MVWLSVEIVELGEDGALEVCGVPLEREVLAKLRLKALRCKVWFRLKSDERRFVDLVIRVVKKVRNFFLASVLSPIIERLLSGMGNAQDVTEAVVGKVAYWMRVKGRSLAQKLSRIAQEWGNESAAAWPRDSGFVRYLTVLRLNNPHGASQG